MTATPDPTALLSQFSTGTWIALGIIALLELVLVIVAIVKVVRTPKEEVRGSKVLWILLSVLLTWLGSILTIILSRKPRQFEEVRPIVPDGTREETNAKVTDILYGPDSFNDEL